MSNHHVHQQNRYDRLACKKSKNLNKSNASEMHHLPRVAEPTPPRHDVILVTIVQIFASVSKHSTESSGELSSNPPEIENQFIKTNQVRVEYFVPSI